MNQDKAQDKGGVEHLEDNKSATFSEDIEATKQNRGIDQEIAQFAAQHAVEIDDATNKRLLGLINKRVLTVMLVSVTYFIQSLDKGTMSFAAIMNIQKIFYAGSLVAEFPVNVLCQKFVSVSLPMLRSNRLTIPTHSPLQSATETPLTCLDFSTDGGMQVLCGFDGRALSVGHIRSGGPAIVLAHDVDVVSSYKTLMVERVRANQTGLQNKIFKREQAIEAFTDIQVWFYVLMQILNTLPTSGIGAFGNLIIKDGFGFDVLQTSLLSLVQGTVHILIVTFVAYIARRTQQTLYIMMAICVPMVATTSVLMTVPNGRSTRVGLLIAFYGTFWFNGVAVLLLSLITRNIAGQTKKSIVLTMSLIAWAAGNVRNPMIGPQVFQTKDAPRYRVGFTVHLAFYVAQIVVFFALRLILARRNKSKNEVSKQKGRAEGEVNLDNAFDDMTDMENPEFRYQY
ncbi:2-ketogluconate transporter, putative [Rhizoctonia solani AG-1 IA]|uniref:2-ketogluconate transporter, putative n=1 Tax=Thanatephorus cucumeris (strain AG1-IA) TaxID=983506 RepID=L8WPG2_THACA|nr:2-ketogluconate transporter, putative [Rhizoctonia solani AG-1 IA]